MSLTISRADALALAAGVVLHRNVEGANDERCALHLDGIAQQRIDDFGQRGMDGFLVLDAGERMQASGCRRDCGGVRTPRCMRWW
jgi:hypothetical protein